MACQYPLKAILSIPDPVGTQILRELFGTLLALQRPHLRGEANRLAQERSLFCSAFVQHCFREDVQRGSAGDR